MRKIVKLFSSIGFDKVVSANVFCQVVILVTSPVTLYFIGTSFSREAQGYYYTFASVLGLQNFLELGFSQCIVNFSSHEFANLEIRKDGALSGDGRSKSRLISIIRLSLKWYSAIAVFIMFFVCLGGYFFFHFQKDYGIVWVIPWVCLCFITAVSIILLPIGSILEGCNQYLWLANSRMWTKLFGSIALWIALINGLGLYSASISLIVSTTLFIIAFVRKWKGLIFQVLHSNITHSISWIDEIWPFQWKVAVGWICGFFIFSLFNPVLFAFQGAIVAGQMGMTWAITSSLNGMANIWTNTKASKFGIYVAKRNNKDLDSLWLKSTIQSVLICLIGSVVVILIIMFIKKHYLIGERFLGISEILILCFASVVNQVIFSENLYLRAHQREPLLLVFVFNAFFTGLAVYLFGRYLNVFAVCASYAFFLTLSAFFSTIIFIKHRKKWSQSYYKYSLSRNYELSYM